MNPGMTVYWGYGARAEAVLGYSISLNLNQDEAKLSDICLGSCEPVCPDHVEPGWGRPDLPGGAGRLPGPAGAPRPGGAARHRGAAAQHRQ